MQEFPSPVETAESDRCYINTIPPEIISEILLTALHDLGGDIRSKYSFPLLHRRISTQFYDIINGNCRLWRYLYIRQPVHRHIHNHLARSEPLSLIADVAYHGSGKLGKTNWREIINALIPAIPRLTSLVFHSEKNNEPLDEVLRYHMPMLKFLDIKGQTRQSSHSPGPQLRRPQLPAIRTLRSDRFFHWENGQKVPQTIVKLYLEIGRSVVTQPFEPFWGFLPPNLRVLELGHLTWQSNIMPPVGGKLSLPSLTSIRLSEAKVQEMSILRYLDLPRLQKLSIHVVNYAAADVDLESWALELPVLTHFEWESNFKLPRMHDFLYGRDALVCVRLEASWLNSPTAANFATVLASDPTLLPRLQDLKLFGSSILHLKKIVQDRPSMRRLEIHWTDLCLRYDDPLESYEGWRDCAAWLASHIELVEWAPIFEGNSKTKS